MKPTADDQRRRFKEAARALGCDESETTFDEKLKVIARHKATSEPKQLDAPDESKKVP